MASSACGAGTFASADGSACILCANPRWCGPNSTCIEGRQGRGCFECATSFTPLQGACERCPAAQWVTLLPAALVFLVGLSALILLRRAVRIAVAARQDGSVAADGHSAMKRVASAVVLLSAVQTACTIGSMDVGWPLSVRWANAVIGRVATLNVVDAVSPQCLLPLEHSARFALRMLLPLAPIAVLGVLSILLRPGTACESLRHHVVCVQTTLRGTSVSIFVLSFMLTSNTAASPFDCVGEGAGYMREKPDVRCEWGSEWDYYAGLGLAVLLSCTGVIFGIKHMLDKFAHRTHTDANFMRTLGSLYLRYERGWLWWEAIVLTRKMMLVLIARVLSRWPLAQLVGTATLMAGSMLLQLWQKPYLSDDLDRIEISMLAACGGHVALGFICYYSAPSEALVVALVAALVLLAGANAAPSLRRVWTGDSGKDSKTGDSGASVHDEEDDALPVQGDQCISVAKAAETSKKYVV